MEADWQINYTKIKDRNQYLLQSEKLSDCRFLVGTPSNQSLIAGHRLLLAMASPVFERMFYGSLTEKDDPIIIPDVQPEAFEAMLDYIYTDEISISSFNNAFDLYYVAKKYMLPHVVEHCTNFLLVRLSPKNACRAYEFGKLHEDPRLIESSMQHIAINTLEVITDPSFMDIEVSTLMDILDQDRLNIDSELDLFNCILKLAYERGILNDGDKDTSIKGDSENAYDVVEEEIKLEAEDSNSGAASISTGTCSSIPNVVDEVVEGDSCASASGNAGESTADINNFMDAHGNTLNEAMLRQAVKKIRFLSMTPQQFAEGPARSKLLEQSEALAIIIKILSPFVNNDWPMPEGFCQSSIRDSADINHMHRYCVCACLKTDIYNRPCYNLYENETALTFKVDTNIYLLGVQIKSKCSFRLDIIESFSACIENMQGSVIALSSSIENKFDSTFEFTFNSPIFIYRNQKYNIKINNMHGYNFLMSTWDREMLVEGVKFSIYPGNAFKIDLDSTISCIVFSTQQDPPCRLVSSIINNINKLL